MKNTPGDIRARVDLRGAVEEAARGADPRSILHALAILSPGAAIETLLRDRDAQVGQLTPDELAGVVAEAASDPSVPIPDRIAFLEAYAERLPPGTVGRLVSRIPTDGRQEVLARIVTEAATRDPFDPLLLRQAFALAAESGDSRRAHECLDRLGRVEDGQATMQWIHRARSTLDPQPHPEVRIALLSSFTVDPLAHRVDFEVRQLGLNPEIYVAPFNSWAQELISEDSALYRFGPEVVFLSLAIDDLVPDLEGAADSEDLERSASDVVYRVGELGSRLRERCDGVLVVHGFHSAYRDPFGLAAGCGAPDRSRWLSQLNARLSERLREVTHTYVLDMQELLLRRPSGPSDDPKMRHLAGLRVVGPALAEVANAYAGYISAVKGLTRKCVILDLDGTLWGGIIGEDGIGGIRLGRSAPGSEYREFQRYLSTLGQRGILLAICSKNNPEDALEAVRSHDEMVLREDSFSAMRINWKPKPENVIEIAGDLGIGVDSMVFVDDNPHERELMRQALPEVLTPEMPADPSRFRETLERLPQLQTLVVTDVDRVRVAQYRAKRDRERLRGVADSLERYLASLKIHVQIGQATGLTLPRVHQLFQRTNQFNLTTRRYDRSALDGFAEAPDWRLYTLRARDRFGDHGLVAAALVRTQDRCWTIDSFLMSCRVISYGVETALLHVITRDAAGAGAQRLIGEFIESPKNQPAREFYSNHGFAPDESDGDVVRWSFTPARDEDGEVKRPSWIRVEVA